MKHRWIGGLLLSAALTLAACAPPDAGADDESAVPSAEASTAPGADVASPTPEATPAEDYDEY
jgi:hypothetical protein